MSIRFLKLFHNVKIGEIPEGIICYRKMEWRKEITDDGSYQEVVTEYKHYLRINLWLFYLEFNWIK